MSSRILIVEDDAVFRSLVEDNLLFEGYKVDVVDTGESTRAYLDSSSPDLIILDLTLPDCDGITLCPLLRKREIPIVILTARGQKADKLKALGLGADDYLTKPIDLEELLARIRAVLRRTRPSVERLAVGRLVIDFRMQQARCGRSVVPLTHHEFQLIKYLAERPGQVVHREELLAEVWGYRNTKVTSRSVDQTVFRLRKKIESDPHHPVFVRTAHCDGYCLVIAPQRSRSNKHPESGT